MSTATLSPQKIAGIKRSKKFQALVSVGTSEDEALRILGGVTESAPVNAEREAAIASLVAASFSREDAEAIVDGQYATSGAVAEAVKPQTDKDRIEALVSERSDVTWGRGRVYVNTEILEAAVRVLKGGGPAIVKTSGVGKRVAVALWREESGDVAVHSLIEA